MPSGDVITRFVPLVATATNIPSSGDQVTAHQPDAADADLLVHVIPSGEVITRFVPAYATATNNPSSGDQVTERQVDASDADLLVQVYAASRSHILGFFL
jgi:hypothetical protein